MRGLLLFLFSVELVHCSCPKGFELVRDGECRGFYASVSVRDDQLTDLATGKCAEINGKPLIIHNDEQQTYFSRQNPSNSSNRMALGLLCNTNSKKWQWVDGTPLDYRPPVIYDSVLDKACVSGCAFYMGTNGFWGAWCNTDVGPFTVYCTTQLQQPVPGNDGCDSFSDDSEDGECYQVGDIAESWQEAQMSCAKLGANLASVHNGQENSFIRRLAVGNGAANGVYLGATMSGKGNNFSWIDGSDWDYENFHQGFPVTGFGDCLAMDTSNTAGSWMNIDCAAQLPVACSRHQKDSTPTCTSGPFKEGEIITSPGFPFSASLYCDYFLTVETGKNVEVEIIFLQANTCCDSLVLYEGYLGGNVIATITGEKQNVTYTTTSSNIMRVNWQPNGGVNVMGMAMTFRGV